MKMKEPYYWFNEVFVGVDYLHIIIWMSSPNNPLSKISKVFPINSLYSSPNSQSQLPFLNLISIAFYLTGFNNTKIITVVINSIYIYIYM